jgi:hypothetical protein
MQVVQDFGVNGAFPAQVGGTGTTVKYFGRNQAYNAGATWTSPLTPSSTSAAGLMVVPPDNKLNAQLLDVVASGSFFPSSAITSSETVNVAVYAVTGTIASPTYTSLGDIATYSPGVDGIWYNFSIELSLFGSNDSGIVGGVYNSFVNNTQQRNNVVLANSLTGIVFGQSTSSPNQTPGALGGPFGLVVGVTFSQSDAANKARLYEFSISC